MAVDEKITTALDIRNLPQLPDLKVIDLGVNDYTDTSGEPSLRVWVILDESVDAEKITGQSVITLKSAIRESLRKLGVKVFVYISLMKPSERDDTGED